jgi:hypothetical protein
MSRVCLLLGVCVLATLCLAAKRAPAAFNGEAERLAMYKERGYGWPPGDELRYLVTLTRHLIAVAHPPPNRRPNTPEYHHLVKTRAHHLSDIADTQQRWDGWLNLAKQVVLSLSDYMTAD